MLAITRIDSLEMVRTLLQKCGADPTHIHTSGDNLLQISIQFKGEDIPRFLRDYYDFNMWHKNKKGQTALDLCKENKKSLILTKLIERKAKE